MKYNGESIYATGASPFEKLEWGRCTQKTHGSTVTLYLHVFDWPKRGKLLVPGLQSPVKSCRYLANGWPMKTYQNDEGVIVSLPGKALDPIDTVVVLEVKAPLVISEKEEEQKEEEQ